MRRKLPGVVEIAEILGVSKQRADQLRSEPDFPAPVDRWARGNLWARSCSARSLVRLASRAGPSDQLTPQRTAFFTSALIFFSSAAVNIVSAKEVGHMLPSSRFASSSKPNVAYLELNFSALLKKQTTFPSLA
jgi:hypothetical protein